MIVGVTMISVNMYTTLYKVNTTQSQESWHLLILFILCVYSCFTGYFCIYLKGLVDIVYMYLQTFFNAFCVYLKGLILFFGASRARRKFSTLSSTILQKHAYD